MKMTFFSIFLTVLFSVQLVFACTLSTKPLGKFDETEYVFIGEVMAYTEPVETKKFQGAAYGLIIKVKENVYLPKMPKAYFEVFPIQLWSDCSKSGTAIEKLKEEFPVKSEVRVIAKEAEILQNNPANENIRLEDRPGENSSIVVNFDEKNLRLTTAESYFDYKSYKHDDEDSVSKYLLPNFEIRKDLLRLSRAKNHQEVTAILDKLIFAAPISDLSFSSLLKNHALDEAEYDRYYEAELKMNSPETYEQYKVYKSVLTELLKAGYPRDKAEKTLGKALQAGTDFEKQKLLQKSLQILRRK